MLKIILFFSLCVLVLVEGKTTLEEDLPKRVARQIIDPAKFKLDAEQMQFLEKTITDGLVKVIELSEKYTHDFIKFAQHAQDPEVYKPVVERMSKVIAHGLEHAVQMVQKLMTEFVEL